MPELFSLTCPTCGANLQIDGESNRFHCEHCGNNYLLDHKVSEMDETMRKHLAPVVTYTKTMGQWLRVAEYDLILHKAEMGKRKEEKLLYIEVEYENKTSEPVKYRPDLPESLQVGISIYTDSTPDLQVRYENIKIETLASPTECETD